MDDSPPRNLYETLDVPKDASLATIRRAYLQLAFSCHPDRVARNVHNEAAKTQKAEQFFQVQCAYEVLRDEIRRQHYDETIRLGDVRTAPTRGRKLSAPRIFDISMRGNMMYETKEPAGSPSELLSTNYTTVKPSPLRKNLDGQASTMSYDSDYFSGSTSSHWSEDMLPTPQRTNSSISTSSSRSHAESPAESSAEYICLYPNCGHVSSRAHDLERHMTVHFPPAMEELLDCKYEWCGRTGSHGFKREDHRKEHYRNVHMKGSEYPKVRGRGSGLPKYRRPRPVQPSPCLPADSENRDPLLQIRTMDKSAAKDKSVPPSDNPHRPGQSEGVITQLGNPQNPQIDDIPPDDLGAQSKSELKPPLPTPPTSTNMAPSIETDFAELKTVLTSTSQVLERLSANEAGQYCASLNIQWDILNFMEDQFRDEDLQNTALGPIITISGSAQHAQATTCSEYTRMFWPVHGSKILDALQHALDSPFHMSSSFIVACLDDAPDDAPSSQANLEFAISQKSTFLSIRSGTQGFIVDAVQQLAWMGAALRTSRDGRVQYCDSKLEAVSKAKRGESASFHITYDMVSPGEQDRCCWLPLFTNPVIAHGFPTANRNDYEIGLEIPLEMMAALGGARHVTDFEGGLVLKGHSAMFVPVKRHPGSVQWHLIRRSDDERITYRDLSKKCPNRAMLEEVNHDFLQNARAFLGWWKSSETYLGTRDAAYESIDWSSAAEARRPARLSGGNIGFQTMITGQLNFIMGAKDGRLHFSQKGPFQRIVQCAERTPVVLYDHKDCRAWFVPGLDVMLHILGTRHHISPYKIDGKDVQFFPLDPGKHKDAAAEAVAVNQSRLLYERDVSEEKGYYFKDAMLDIWSQMERLMEKEDSVEATSGLALHGTMQSKLCGWEFMSLVHEKNYRRKEVNVAKSSGGWVDLINDIDGLVLFGTGFGEIIKPVSDLGNLCHGWRSLPTGKDYLAAGVSILELLYSEAGSRLSHKHLSSNCLQWHRGSTLFEQCKGATSNGCDCDRTQQIYHDSLFRTFGQVRPPGRLEENGCVIFGRTHHPFKRARKLALTEKAAHNLPGTSIQDVGNTEEDQARSKGTLSPSPPATVSPNFRDINSYTIRSSKRPTSLLDFDDDRVHDETAESKRRRTLSHAQTLNFDTCEEHHRDEDQTSSSDDYGICPQEYQSMFKHNTKSKKGWCPVHTWKAKSRKAKIEDQNCSNAICPAVVFEPPGTVELVSATNGTRRSSMDIVRGRERQSI